MEILREINKESVMDFLKDSTCKSCGVCQPSYIWKHPKRLCKRCEKFGYNPWKK